MINCSIYTKTSPTALDHLVNMVEIPFINDPRAQRIRGPVYRRLKGRDIDVERSFLIGLDFELWLTPLLCSEPQNWNRSY